MFQFAPLLWGAGLGALGSLVMGKDPLKGAMVGGATGGLLGSIPALGAGATAGGAGSGLASNGTGIAIDAIASSPFLPTALQGSTLAKGVGTGVTAGAGGAGINLAQGANELAYGFNPVAEIAGKGSIDNLAQYANGTGYDLLAKDPSLWDKLKPYVDVRDITGSAMSAFNQPQQQQQAPSGNVTQGRAPQGNDVMSLLQSMKRPERKRLTLL